MPSSRRSCARSGRSSIEVADCAETVDREKLKDASTTTR
jgi:hypothetical protein